jgi:hypothetical protein
MDLDLSAALLSLSQRRRVFHSEADFRFALAWQIHLADPGLDVRLEVPLSKSESLDLLVIGSSVADSVAFELKYPTRAWRGIERDERYDVKNHSALDHRRYDILKDVHRVERFVAGHPGSSGFVVIITNDSGYWVPSTGYDLRMTTHSGSTREPVSSPGFATGVNSRRVHDRASRVSRRRAATNSPGRTIPPWMTRAEARSALS